MVRITEVASRSRAYRAGVRAGDFLVSINGEEIRDVLDYRFYLAEREIILSCLRDGEPYEAKITKDIYDDIGLSFESALMDEKIRCKNGCIFCFIDQNPEGMRESIYFKDDDSRLSFLHGNYITLTNMKERDIDRIIKMRFSPVRVSVHTTNPDLRVQMMKNKHAGEVLSYLDRIAEAGLELHAQIVLCRGVNDGDELQRTLDDLAHLIPSLTSVSVVPAGLTDHRDGLYPLSPFTREECREIIATVTAFGDKLLERHGARTVYLSDEFYLKAELPLPEEAYYEGYSQIENGVGMLRSFEEEAACAIDDFEKEEEEEGCVRCVSVVTGEAAYAELSSVAHRLEAKFPLLKINVYCIKNHFFGQHITVAGLLTGKDIFEQLEGKNLGEQLFLPRACLRSEGDLFLCGMASSELEEKLGVPITFIENDGDAFVCALLGAEE